MATTKKSTNKPEAAKPSTLTPAERSRLALSPSLNGAAVIEAYQANVMGKDTDMEGLVLGLRDTFKEVKGGDLHTLEAMLIGQATALQTIFTSLARRAANQERLPQYQAFLGLALKAQAQSRATISALVELKYPKQATFVKQANIAHGPQQVNNGADESARIAHAEQAQPQQNELLEHQNANVITPRVDTRAAQTPERSHPALGTVEQVHRAAKPRG